MDPIEAWQESTPPEDPTTRCSAANQKRDKYTDIIIIMFPTDESLFMDRYLIKCQSVQTLSVDMDLKQVPLPCSANAPSDHSRKADVRNSRNPNDQLHLQGPNLQGRINQ